MSHIWVKIRKKRYKIIPIKRPPRLRFLRASAATSSTKSKSSKVNRCYELTNFLKNSVISQLLEFAEDKTSSDKSFLLYLLLNQGIYSRRRPRRRRRKSNLNNSKKLFLEKNSGKLTQSKPSNSTTEIVSSSSAKSPLRIDEFSDKFVIRHSTLCVLQYFCSDYLVYKKRNRISKQVTTN